MEVRTEENFKMKLRLDRGISGQALGRYGFSVVGTVVALPGSDPL